MIGHHDPSVEVHVGTAMRHLHPFLGDDIPEIEGTILPSTISPSQQTRPRVQIVTQ